MSILQNTLKGLYRNKEKSKYLGQFMEKLRNGHVNSGWFVKPDNKTEMDCNRIEKVWCFKEINISEWRLEWV